MTNEQQSSLLPYILNHLGASSASKISLFEALASLYACGKKEQALSILNTEDIDEVNHEMVFFIIEAFWKTGEDFWLDVASKCKMEEVVLSNGESFTDDRLFDELYNPEALHYFVKTMVEAELWNGETMFTTSYGQASLRALSVMDNLAMANHILKHDLKYGIPNEKAKEEFAVALSLRYANYADGDKEIDTLWRDVFKNNYPKQNTSSTDFTLYQSQKTHLRSDAPLHVLVGHFLYRIDQSIIGQELRAYSGHWSQKDWVTTLKHIVHGHISMDEKNNFLHSMIDEGLNHVDQDFRRKIIFASVNHSERFWKDLTLHSSFERLLSSEEIVSILTKWQQKHPISTKTTKGLGFWGNEADTFLAFNRFLTWGPEELEQRLQPNFYKLFESIKENPQSYLPFFAKNKEIFNEVTKADLKFALIDLTKGWDGAVIEEKPKMVRKM